MIQVTALSAALFAITSGAGSRCRSNGLNGGGASWVSDTSN